MSSHQITDRVHLLVTRINEFVAQEPTDSALVTELFGQLLEDLSSQTTTTTTSATTTTTTTNSIVVANNNSNNNINVIENTNNTIIQRNVNNCRYETISPTPFEPTPGPCLRPNFGCPGLDVKPSIPLLQYDYVTPQTSTVLLTPAPTEAPFTPSPCLTSPQCSHTPATSGVNETSLCEAENAEIPPLACFAQQQQRGTDFVAPQQRPSKTKQEKLRLSQPAFQALLQPLPVTTTPLTSQPVSRSRTGKRKGFPRKEVTTRKKRATLAPVVLIDAAYYRWVAVNVPVFRSLPFVCAKCDRAVESRHDTIQAHLDKHLESMPSMCRQCPFTEQFRLVLLHIEQCHDTAKADVKASQIWLTQVQPGAMQLASRWLTNACEFYFATLNNR